MGLIEDIDAIYADDALTVAQKHLNAAKAKANGWRGALMALGDLPQTWNFSAKGSAWSITLTEITVSDGSIHFDGAVTKDGVTLTRSVRGAYIWPVVIQNPPIFFPDPSGTYTRGGTTFKHDIAPLARSIFSTVFASAVP